MAKYLSHQTICTANQSSDLTIESTGQATKKSMFSLTISTILCFCLLLAEKVTLEVPRRSLDLSEPSVSVCKVYGFLNRNGPRSKSHHRQGLAVSESRQLQRLNK
jgi:hypothetical protein